MENNSENSQPLQPVKPDSYLAWAILSTILCCLPLGIVSIVYASRVDGLWFAGNHDEARQAARKARNWFWAAVGCGLAATLFYILFLTAAFILGAMNL